MPANTSAVVLRYVDSKRGDGYLEARRALSGDDAVDAALLRAFFAKALAQFPAASQELEQLGPNAWAAYLTAAAKRPDPWCAVLCKFTAADAPAAFDLLLRARRAASVPDGGSAEDQAAIAKAAKHKPLVAALQPVVAQFALARLFGWAAILLHEGSNASVQAVAKVVDAESADLTGSDALDYLRFVAGAIQRTRAVDTLLARIETLIGNREGDAAFTELLAAIGLSEHPPEYEAKVEWRANAGFALLFSFGRYGPADMPRWDLIVGNDKGPKFEARSMGQFPNKLGIPAFVPWQFETWLPQLEAKLKIRFEDDIAVAESGFPRAIGGKLRAFLMAGRAAARSAPAAKARKASKVAAKPSAKVSATAKTEAKSSAKPSPKKVAAKKPATKKARRPR
jgi:hypothetical protein